MIRRIWPLTVVPLLIAAECPGDKDDTACEDSACDSAVEWYNGPLQINTLDYSCTTGTTDQWYYYAKTDGLAGLVDLEIFETGDGNYPSNPSAVWDEAHDLTNIAYDEETGAWDEWEATLDDVAAPGDVVSGSTTLWDCGWDDGGSLAFMVTMWDDASPAATLDCAIWGYLSDDYFNGDMGNGCVCFDPDGDCTN